MATVAILIVGHEQFSEGRGMFRDVDTFMIQFSTTMQEQKQQDTHKN